MVRVQQNRTPDSGRCSQVAKESAGEDAMKWEAQKAGLIDYAREPEPLAGLRPLVRLLNLPFSPLIGIFR